MLAVPANVSAKNGIPIAVMTASGGKKRIIQPENFIFEWRAKNAKQTEGFLVD
jgi:hypothetical protein